MKHRLPSLICLSAVLLLVSCAGGSAPEASSFATVSSEEEAVSSASSGKDYSLSPWGVEAAKYMDESYGVELPYFGNYEYEFSMENDEFGDPVMWIYAYMEEENIDTALGLYSNACFQDGYEVVYGPRTEFIDGVIYTYNVYVADKAINEHWGLELTFLEGNHGGKECVGIYVVPYILVDKTSWPTYMLEYYNGYDVPHYEEEGVSYNAWVNPSENWGNYVGICVEGADLEAGTSYSELLAKQGYDVYSATDPDTEGELFIAGIPGMDECIYYYYDLESYYGFYIYVINVSAQEFMEN